MSKFSMTQIFIGINVLVYALAVLMFSHVVSFTPQNLAQLGGVTQQSGITSYLSANFIHAGLFHIVMNMIALKDFGAIVESRLGAKLYAGVYLLSGIIIMAVSSHFVSDHSVLIGASGVILALFGIVITMCVHHLIVSHTQTPAFKAFLRAMIINIAIISAISLIPGVSATAHLVGFIVGVIIMIGIIIKCPKQRYF